MLIIDIVLAVTAWRKGWGAKALLPFAFGVIAVFFLASLMLVGMPREVVAGLAALCDVAVLASLICMALINPAPPKIHIAPSSGSETPGADDIPKAA
jgi:hypothetical protein